MNYNDFLEMLGNTNPICFADYKIRTDVDDIPKYNSKYAIKTMFRG